MLMKSSGKTIKNADNDDEEEEDDDGSGFESEARDERFTDAHSVKSLAGREAREELCSKHPTLGGGCSCCGR